MRNEPVGRTHEVPRLRGQVETQLPFGNPPIRLHRCARITLDRQPAMMVAQERGVIDGPRRLLGFVAHAGWMGSIAGKFASSFSREGSAAIRACQGALVSLAPLAAKQSFYLTS